MTWPPPATAPTSSSSTCDAAWNGPTATSPAPHHIPFNELPDRAAQVPDGEVWVYCRSGYRSTIAASMLAARGRSVVSVDDEFTNAAAAGLPLDARRPPLIPDSTSA